MKDINYKKKYLKYKLKYTNQKAGANFLDELLHSVAEVSEVSGPNRKPRRNSPSQAGHPYRRDLTAPPAPPPAARRKLIDGLYPPRQGIHVYDFNFNGANKQIVILTEAHQSGYHVGPNRISAFNFIHLYQRKFNAQVFTEMPDNLALADPDNPSNPSSFPNIPPPPVGNETLTAPTARTAPAPTARTEQMTLPHLHEAHADAPMTNVTAQTAPIPTSININKMYEFYSLSRVIDLPVSKDISDILKNIDLRDGKLNTALEQFISNNGPDRYNYIKSRIISFFNISDPYYSGPSTLVIAIRINHVITHYPDEYLEHREQTEIKRTYYGHFDLDFWKNITIIIISIVESLITEIRQDLANKEYIINTINDLKEQLVEEFENQNIIGIRFFCRQILSKIVEITYINHFFNEGQNHHLILIGYHHYDFINGYLNSLGIFKKNQIQIDNVTYS